MATITGLTAERMREIEAGSIVDGMIDANGHLILTRYDGQEIDAGSALVAIPTGSTVQFLSPTYDSVTPPGSYPDGISLLWIDGSTNAATWPTFAGKWGSLVTVNYTSEQSDQDTHQTWTRLSGGSVTPEQWFRMGSAGAGWTEWRQIATTAYVDGRLQDLGTIPQGDPISAYPAGISMSTMPGVTGPVWSSVPNTQFGTILTVKGNPFRSFQLMQVEDGYLHIRRYNEDAGGWRPWTKVLTEQRLGAADYNQARAFTGYPWGLSYLYLSGTESTSGGWSFPGKFGLVTTFRYSDDFAVQTWQKHQGGLGGHTELWQRTANSGAGWSPWRVISDEVPLYAIQLGNSSVANGTGVPLAFAGAPLSPAGGYVRSTNRITVPATGTYEISYRYNFNGSVGTGRAFVQFTVTSLSQLQYTVPGSSTTFARMPIGNGEDMSSALMSIGLNAGAQVGVDVWQTSGLTRTVDGIFQIRRAS